MEIAVKALFGALVAVGIHYAAYSKHSYLAGLVPSIPIFALFAHAIFANSGRSDELQGAAHFGLATVGPFVLYLVAVWWFSTRVNMWVALLLATAVWGITTLIAFAIWYRVPITISSVLNARFAIAIFASALMYSFLGYASRLYTGGSQSAKVLSGSWRGLGRRKFLDKPVIGCVAVLIGLSLLLASPIQIQNDRLPGEEHTCGLLQAALVLGPSGAQAQQIQHSVMASYVTLAKDADLAGDANLADMYSGRARSVLFGSWVHASEQRPKFC